MSINVEFAEDYIKENGQRVLMLFSTYQRIELFLFMYLYLPDTKIEGIERTNKAMQSNTFGSLIQRYSKKYPKDELKLLSDLKGVKDQRNSFMHSFWILLAIYGKEGLETCNLFFADYEKRAGDLERKILDAKFDV